MYRSAGFFAGGRKERFDMFSENIRASFSNPGRRPYLKYSNGIYKSAFRSRKSFAQTTPVTLLEYGFVKRSNLERKRNNTFSVCLFSLRFDYCFSIRSFAYTRKRRPPTAFRTEYVHASCVRGHWRTTTFDTIKYNAAKRSFSFITIAIRYLD